MKVLPGEPQIKPEPRHERPQPLLCVQYCLKHQHKTVIYLKQHTKDLTITTNLNILALEPRPFLPNENVIDINEHVSLETHAQSPSAQVRDGI